jgi:hypothetical protein
MLSRGQKDERSVATGDDSSNAAGQTIQRQAYDSNAVGYIKSNNLVFSFTTVIKSIDHDSKTKLGIGSNRRSKSFHASQNGMG